MSCVHLALVSLVLYTGAIAIDKVVYKWTGSNTAYFMGSVAATLAKGSTCTFSVRGILLIAQLLNLLNLMVNQLRTILLLVAVEKGLI